MFGEVLGEPAPHLLVAAGGGRRASAPCGTPGGASRTKAHAQAESDEVTSGVWQRADFVKDHNYRFWGIAGN
ncbi:hypothetical protein [Nonomuraea sp. NPDC005501]|uniref:hypothetical protein n=1 Tax=Nonomuraea sp. NPDC005501 TaxID=3156884 RepID=UPI0033B771F9